MLLYPKISHGDNLSSASSCNEKETLIHICIVPRKHRIQVVALETFKFSRFILGRRENLELIERHSPSTHRLATLQLGILKLRYRPLKNLFGASQRLPPFIFSLDTISFLLPHDALQFYDRISRFAAWPLNGIVCLPCSLNTVLAFSGTSSSLIIAGGCRQASPDRSEKY